MFALITMAYCTVLTIRMLYLHATTSSILLYLPCLRVFYLMQPHRLVFICNVVFACYSHLSFTYYYPDIFYLHATTHTSFTCTHVFYLHATTQTSCIYMLPHRHLLFTYYHTYIFYLHATTHVFYLHAITQMSCIYMLPHRHL